MKMNLDFLKNKNQFSKKIDEEGDYFLGNPELAENTEIYSVLSGSDFIKTFPGPADFQYDILRKNLCLSKESTKNSLAYLKNFFKTTKNPNFCLIKFNQFLHTALGNQKNVAFNKNTPLEENFKKEQQDISKILEKGFNDISSDPEIKYFLGVTLKPEVILRETQSFEKMERDLTPIQISGRYFIQDNGHDPLPIFYYTDNTKEFKMLIEEQSNFFKNARSENRSEFPKNPSLKEMKDYKDKFLKSTINFPEMKVKIREKIKNSTHQLTPQEIEAFFPDSHDTYELINDPLMSEFRTFSNPEIRSILEKEFGIDFKEIPLKEQMYFLTNISNRTNITIKPVQEFTQKFKNLGLRTFLSIEQGGKEMGDKILQLGEKLPKEVAEKVFAKYGEIIDVADRAEDEIKKLYKKENIPNKVSQSVKEILLKKGAEFLSGLGGKDSLINEKDVLRELENIKTETIILGSSYLELFKSGENINFEEIKGTTVEKISSENLSEEQKKEIVNAYKNGRPKETYENEEHLKLLTNEFSENLNKKETYVFNIRFKGEIIAFADFQKIDEETFHIGGLTFLEDVRNPVVAEAVMNSIMKEFSKYNIVAEVHSENKILNMYKKRLGFKVIGEMPREENAGELYFKIKREKDSNGKENSFDFKTAA